ncbi:hypothetical protein LTR80_011671 [Exophiala xenobiotica]
MSNSSAKTYLHPRRDLPEYEDWVMDKVRNEYPTMLIGKDVDSLMKRIDQPLVYFIKYSVSEPLISLHQDLHRRK